MNTTAARVPRVGVATHRIDTMMTATTAVTLIAHCGSESGDTSEAVVCQKRRFKYSAKIRLITAFPPSQCHNLDACFTLSLHDVPGFKADIAVHANRYDTRGP